MHQDYEKHIGVSAGSGQRLICCAKINKCQLSAAETCEMRVYYWAAYYGRSKTVNRMVMHRKWSPFIKSFRNQSVMTAAIRGERVAVVQRLAGAFHYENEEESALAKVFRDVFNKDVEDNSSLHYAYQVDNPAIR